MKVVQRFLRWSFALGLPILLGFSAWQVWVWWRWASGPPLASSAAVKEVEIKIPSGTSTQQIGRKLEDAGLIRSYCAWQLWARWLHFQDPKGEFKAGTYHLSPTESLSAIASTIQRGQEVERSFTIPEGWSLRQMSTYFQEQGFFPAKDFLAAASHVNSSQYPWLPTGLPTLEGFLYPDTYKISSGRVTPQAVVQQMLHQFEQKALPLYRQGQNQTQLNLLEWVTLASMVEKEAVVPQERPRIAGVFVSRLRRGIRLESDPTVEYALGIRQTVAQPLTLTQVRTPSPYNTYVNPGLPPTPIASPGLSSLKAALNPEHTPYLYFVARYDGTHVFSRTLSAHQAAQASIRKQQAAQHH